jgi:hypothetical protein
LRAKLTALTDKLKQANQANKTLLTRKGEMEEAKASSLASDEKLRASDEKLRGMNRKVETLNIELSKARSEQSNRTSLQLSNNTGPGSNSDNARLSIQLNEMRSTLSRVSMAAEHNQKIMHQALKKAKRKHALKLSEAKRNYEHQIASINQRVQMQQFMMMQQQNQQNQQHPQQRQQTNMNMMGMANTNTMGMGMGMGMGVMGMGMNFGNQLSTAQVDEISDDDPPALMNVSNIIHNDPFQSNTQQQLTYSMRPAITAIAPQNSIPAANTNVNVNTNANVNAHANTTNPQSSNAHFIHNDKISNYNI